MMYLINDRLRRYLGEGRLGRLRRCGCCSITRPIVYGKMTLCSRPRFSHLCRWQWHCSSSYGAHRMGPMMCPPHPLPCIDRLIIRWIGRWAPPPPPPLDRSMDRSMDRSTDRSMTMSLSTTTTRTTTTNTTSESLFRSFRLILYLMF